MRHLSVVTWAGCEVGGAPVSRWGVGGAGADNSVLDNSDQCITIAIPSSVFQCHKGSSGHSGGTLGFSF